MEAKKTPPLKRKTLAQNLTSIDMEELQDFEVVELDSKSMVTNFYIGHMVQGQQRRIKKMQSSKNVLCVFKQKLLQTW
jgi:hypothetical protein